MTTLVPRPYGFIDTAVLVQAGYTRGRTTPL